MDFSKESEITTNVVAGDSSSTMKSNTQISHDTPLAGWSVTKTETSDMGTEYTIILYIGETVHT